MVGLVREVILSVLNVCLCLMCQLTIIGVIRRHYVGEARRLLAVVDKQLESQDLIAGFRKGGKI